MRVEQLDNGTKVIHYTPEEYEKLYSVREKFEQLILTIADPDLLDDVYHAAACARYGIEEGEVSIPE